MSRMIEEDALIKELLTENQRCVTSTGQELTMNMIVSFINNQPTAYDVEKVVAELESKRHCRELTNYYGDVIGVRNIDTIKIDKAIDIVRKGGVE